MAHLCMQPAASSYPAISLAPTQRHARSSQPPSHPAAQPAAPAHLWWFASLSAPSRAGRLCRVEAASSARACLSAPSSFWMRRRLMRSASSCRQAGRQAGTWAGGQADWQLVDEAQADALCLQLQAGRGRRAGKRTDRQIGCQHAARVGQAMQAWRRAGTTTGNQPSTLPLTHLPTAAPTCALCTAASSSAASSPSLASAAAAL